MQFHKKKIEIAIPKKSENKMVDESPSTSTDDIDFENQSDETTVAIDEITNEVRKMSPRKNLQATNKKDKKKDKSFDFDQDILNYLNNIEKTLLYENELPKPKRNKFIIQQLTDILNELRENKISTKYEKAISNLLDNTNNITKYWANKDCLKDNLYIGQILANLIYSIQSNDKIPEKFTTDPHLVENAKYPIKVLNKINYNETSNPDVKELIIDDLSEIQFTGLIIVCDFLLRKNASESLSKEEQDLSDFKSLINYNVKKLAFVKIIEEYSTSKKAKPTKKKQVNAENVQNKNIDLES